MDVDMWIWRAAAGKVTGLALVFLRTLLISHVYFVSAFIRNFLVSPLSCHRMDKSDERLHS